MSKRAPSTTQLLVIAGFALSCFGILLFLWVTFGGPTPFKAKPYEIKIPFNEATKLAAAVRRPHLRRQRSARCRSIAVAPNGKQALATIDIDDKYGPIPHGTQGDPADEDAARRDLRRTDPGRQRRPAARRRGHAARGAGGRIGPARRDLPHLRRRNPRRVPGMDAGTPPPAIQGRGQDFSAALAELEPTFTEFDRLFRSPRHPAAGGAAAIQQRRRRPPLPARARRGARQSDPQLQRRSFRRRPRAIGTSKRSSGSSPRSRTSRE